MAVHARYGAILRYILIVRHAWCHARTRLLFWRFEVPSLFPGRREGGRAVGAASLRHGPHGPHAAEGAYRYHPTLVRDAPDASADLTSGDLTPAGGDSGLAHEKRIWRLAPYCCAV